MSKNIIIINNLFKLIDDNIYKEDINLCKQIIIKKNELLSEKELDNINNLLILIIKDKDIISMIKMNCKLIFEDGKVDYNDIEYIIKLAQCLVELFNNQINFNIDINSILVSNIIEYILIIFIIPYCDNKQNILLMINLIMSLLRTVIYPFKKCNILCCK